MRPRYFRQRQQNAQLLASVSECIRSQKIQPFDWLDHWALQYLEERLGENKWLQKHGGFSPLLTPDPRHMVPPAKGIYHWPGSVLKQAHLLHPPGFFARNCFWSFRNTFSQYFLNFFRTFFNLLQIFEMDEVVSGFHSLSLRKTGELLQYFSVLLSIFNWMATHLIYSGRSIRFEYVKMPILPKKWVYMTCICICCTLDIKVVPQYSYSDFHLILFLNGLWINNYYNKLHMKEPVNFYFRLKWFLCNGYSGRSEYPLRNQAEVVLSWFLFSSQKQLFMQVELLLFW